MCRRCLNKDMNNILISEITVYRVLKKLKPSPEPGTNTPPAQEPRRHRALREHTGASARLVSFVLVCRCQHMTLTLSETQHDSYKLAENTEIKRKNIK